MTLGKEKLRKKRRIPLPSAKMAASASQPTPKMNADCDVSDHKSPLVRSPSQAPASLTAPAFPAEVCLLIGCFYYLPFVRMLRDSVAQPRRNGQREIERSQVSWPGGEPPWERGPELSISDLLSEPVYHPPCWPQGLCVSGHCLPGFSSPLSPRPPHS